MSAANIWPRLLDICENFECCRAKSEEYDRKKWLYFWSILREIYATNCENKPENDPKHGKETHSFKDKEINGISTG